MIKLILMLFSLNAFAEINIDEYARVSDDNTPNSDVEFTSNTIYIPYETNDAGDVRNEHTLLGAAKTLATNTLPQIDFDDSGNGIFNDTNPVLLLSLRHDQNTATYDFIYIAVKEDDDENDTYTVKVKQAIGTSNENIQLSISWENICTEYSNQDCEFEWDDATELEEKDVEIFIFLSDTGTGTSSGHDEHNVGDNGIDPASENGSVFTLKFSNGFDTDSIPALGLTAVKRGDARLQAVWNDNGMTSFSSSDLLSSYIVAAPSAAFNTPGTESWQTVVGNLVGITGCTPFTNEGSVCQIKELEPAISEGSDFVENLVNGTAYDVTVLVEDKWHFVHTLPRSLSATPLKIETFLEAQSCYLFSAGFQTRHYVLDYFRNFRDRYLIPNKYGRVLVDWYYKTAPQYTPYIYKNSAISAIVRGLAYLIYGFMRWLPLWIGLIFVLGVLLNFRKRRSPQIA